MSILIVVILVNYVGMTYGPIGAFLAEFGGQITSRTAGSAA